MVVSGRAGRAAAVRALFRLVTGSMLAWSLTGEPAAAQSPLPFGKSWVPANVKPLMQRPIGLSLVSMHLGETLDVGDLALTLGGQPLPPGVVSLPSVTHTTHVTAVHGDVWLLPFLNVHGTVGHLSGTANDIRPTVAPGILPPGIQIPSSQDFGGTTYGGGLMLAIEYRDIFASYDVAYSRTNVDILKDPVSSVAQGIRVGALTRIGKTQAALYVGGFREGIRSALRGTGLIPPLNPDYSLTVTPRGAWNGLLGANFAFTSRFVVTTEVGLGNRKQFLVTPGVRF